jgi:hypothetical protein
MESSWTNRLYNTEIYKSGTCTQKFVMYMGLLTYNFLLWFLTKLYGSILVRDSLCRTFEYIMSSQSVYHSRIPFVAIIPQDYLDFDTILFEFCVLLSPCKELQDTLQVFLSCKQLKKEHVVLIQNTGHFHNEYDKLWSPIYCMTSSSIDIDPSDIASKRNMIKTFVELPKDCYDHKLYPTDICHPTSTLSTDTVMLGIFLDKKMTYIVDSYTRIVRSPWSAALLLCDYHIPYNCVPKTFTKDILRLRRVMGTMQQNSIVELYKVFPVVDIMETIFSFLTPNYETKAEIVEHLFGRRRDFYVSFS